MGEGGGRGFTPDGISWLVGSKVYALPICLISFILLSFPSLGNLKPVIKSQPKPKDNDGPVRIIVGNTFDKEVRQTEKNVLLEIYAPWCGHCKKLEPVYKKLGKKYKDSDSVVIAKIDGTANDLPMEVQAEGFPTLFLVKGGDLENLIKFEGGERTVASLSAFIEENTTASQTKDEL